MLSGLLALRACAPLCNARHVPNQLTTINGHGPSFASVNVVLLAHNTLTVLRVLEVLLQVVFDTLYIPTSDGNNLLFNIVLIHHD